MFSTRKSYFSSSFLYKEHIKKRFDALYCIHSKDILYYLDQNMGVPMVWKEKPVG